ncbi:MAG: alpha/beta hydrolase-fold protein [candidate division Zixibacteria bacterium]|nr:alpha/beta hydrolase-fold protein [candidate division Zixibacteria bacterium]
MLEKIVILLSVLLTVAIFSGCSDRGITGGAASHKGGIVFNSNHLFGEQLGQSMFDAMSENPNVGLRVYVPYTQLRDNGTYMNRGSSEPCPVLFLLSPFGAGELFYLDHGLKDVADKMIASGEIKPMIIVCINGSNGYGGSFYGDNYAGGRFAQLIGDRTGRPSSEAGATLIDHIDKLYNTVRDPVDEITPYRGGWAISGVGMGGYGAMRIAIRYSENFSSVSAVSAPLDFDGANGDGGFLPLFQKVIRDLDDTTNYHDMDTSMSHPLQTLFFAAATSFSPHDTGDVDDGNVITDTTTYFASGAIKFHLPFDANGAPHEPIWNIWMANDVGTILNNYRRSLDSTKVLLIATPEADYGYYQQTIDFWSHISRYYADSVVTLSTFNGYPGFPANGQGYTYDDLPKILKFHSDNFVIPE